MSLNFCLDAVLLVCSSLYTKYFLPSKFVHEFLKFAYEFFFCFHEFVCEFVHGFLREFASELCTRNSYEILNF